MGMDLRLIPLQYPVMLGTGKPRILGVNRLELDRDYDLHEAITTRAKPQPFPTNWELGNYDDDGLKYLKTDPYGSPLTYTTAAAVSPAFRDVRTSQWNVAVGEFVRSLPPETVIVLWWH